MCSRPIGSESGPQMLTLTDGFVISKSHRMDRMGAGAGAGTRVGWVWRWGRLRRNMPTPPIAVPLSQGTPSRIEEVRQTHMR